MADINSKFEIGVTTGPIRGSRKVHVGAKSGSGVRVAMREIDLEGGEPSVRVYDTSGPYTDPDATIDIRAGLEQKRREWIMARGDVEEYTAREVKPEDNGQLGPDRSGGVPAFPNVAKKVLRAKPGMNVSQMHYARQGIITPEMEYVAERENLGRARLAEYVRDGQDWGAEIPDYVTPEFVRDEIARVLDNRQLERLTSGDADALEKVLEDRLDRLYVAKVYLQSDAATANTEALRQVVDDLADTEYEKHRTGDVDGETERGQVH